MLSEIPNADATFLYTGMDVVKVINIAENSKTNTPMNIQNSLEELASSF